MSRGWESKNIEQQQDAAENHAQKEKARQSAAEIDRQRQLAALRLQRNNILNARTSNPHRRSALQAALAQIEAEMAALGVTGQS